MRVYFIAHEKLLAFVGIEPGSLLEAILRSERCTTELAGPGLIWPNLGRSGKLKYASYTNVHL